MIKAPFNFVPLSDKVYSPKWANVISHDVPFEDGLSGSIELKITAQTPIFVRNGHTKQDAEEKNQAYNSFSNLKERYFIPATSVKGALRSVMQIMSFGKMSLDRDAMFAQREWNNKELYPIKHPTYQKNMHCGYLKEKEDGYEIVDCGIPMRIAHTRIDEYLGNKTMEKHFCKNEPFDITKEYKLGNVIYDPKSAVFKYALTEGVQLSALRFSEDEQYAVEYKDNRVKVSTFGEFEGSIVFTGQPDKWMFPRPIKMTPGAGKFYEFVFLNPEDNARRYHITTEEYKHYEFIYADSADWEYLKKSNNGIPVFFRVEQGKIKDWGLAFLYKLPYEHSPYDILPDEHKSEKRDLAECIFGYVAGKSKDKNQDSLKGRVLFSHAFTENANVCDEVCLSLGSPKASYYPIYIRQKGNKGFVMQYDTYNNGEISGWKRYLVRACCFEKNTGNKNIDTIIKPLDKGSVFMSKMRFHNLKRIELGALLSAISFHNTEGCFHQLGQGKPYGFGKVTIEIASYPSYLPPVEDLLTEYEEVMCEFLNGSWVNSDQMRNLITMAHTEVTDNDVFDYMHMGNNPRDNEFLSVKVAREYLETYQSLCGKSYTAVSLYEKVREERIRKREEEQEKLEQERIQYLKQALEEAKQREEEERKLKNSVPLSEKIANVGKLPTLFGNIRTWMKQNERETLSEEELIVLHNKIVEIYTLLKDRDKKSFNKSFGKVLDSIVGIELAKQWHEEIVNK